MFQIANIESFKLADTNGNEICNTKGKLKHESWSINRTPSISINFEPTYISDDFLNGLYDNKDNLNPCDLKIEGSKNVYIQARKHKKVRINKKWLKRYGYKETFVPFKIELESCEFEPIDNLLGGYSISGKIKKGENKNGL